MKYIISLALSSLPLAVLTSLSIVAAVTNSRPNSVDESRNDDDGGSSKPTAGTPAVHELIEQTRGQNQRDPPLVHELAEVNLWDIQAVDVSSGDENRTRSEQLKTAIAAVRQSIRARQIVDRLSPVMDRVGHQQLAARGESLKRQQTTAEESARSIHELLNGEQHADDVDSSGNERVPGAAAVLQLVERRVENFDQQGRALGRLIEIEVALRDAGQAFDGGDYDRCLGMLAKPPLAAADSKQTLDTIAQLRQRAEYCRDWQKSMATTQSLAASRSTLRLLDSFLSLHPQALHNNEAKKHREITQRRDQLEADILVAELKDVTKLETLLDNGSALVHRLPEKKEEIQQIVDKWLTIRGFPAIECPADLRGKQEAWTKNNQRLLGYFRRPPNVDQWRYWRDLEGFKESKPPLGDEHIPSGSFNKDPAVPKYVQWADAYRDQIGALAKPTASRSQWTEFVKWSTAAQKELGEYQNQQGIGISEEPDRSCAAWSFQDAASFAQGVLNRWEEYQTIMAN
jgi:hypothetical protein